MSLNWNIDKVANHETVCWSKPDANGDSTLRAVTYNLIWATIAVDLNEIKASNIDEWMFRLAVVSLAYNNSDWMQITRQQVEAHIGLNTNASNKTRVAFMRRMTIALTSEANSIVRRNRSEAESTTESV